MSDQNYLPSPNEPEPVIGMAPHVQAAPQRVLPPWLYGLGFLVLAVAILLVWLYPNPPADLETATSQVQAASSQMQAATSQVQGVAAQLQAMDKRLTDTDARLGRLEQRPAAPSAADLGKLSADLAKQSADLAKLSAHVDAVDSRAGDPAQLGVRLDALSGRIEALAGRSQSALDTQKQQIDGLTGRIATLEKASGNLSALTDRLNRVARLQEAGLALSAGKPIGDLPNAPQALTRFAHQAPPTEAQLRLTFPQAEQAALAAEQPGDDKAPFVNRVWERAQGLVTVRRDGDIMIGNPASTVLSKAQASLDAGDLASAVAAVKTLSGPQLQAMSDWLAQATALIGARSALADMAGQV